MRRKRALVLEPAGNLWGSERALLDFLSAARDVDWDIAVCTASGAPILAKLRELGITTYDVLPQDLHRRHIGFRVAARVALAYAVFRTRASLIHVNQGGATRLALTVAKWRRIPVISHVRLAEDVNYVEALGASVNNLPSILCVSEFISRKFSTAASERIVVTDPYTERAQSHGPSPIPLDALSASFVCAGRIELAKGQELFIRAIGELLSRGTKVTGLVIGKGAPGDPYYDTIVRVALECCAEKALSWAGFQDDVVSMARGSAGFVCPSYMESLGRVIFEAWDACTIPIAWKGSGGPAELIGKSGAGILYKYQEPTCLADAMEEAKSHSPHARYQIAELGRRWMRQNCNAQHYAQRIGKVWDQALLSQ